MWPPVIGFHSIIQSRNIESKYKSTIQYNASVMDFGDIHLTVDCFLKFKIKIGVGGM